MFLTIKHVDHFWHGIEVCAATNVSTAIICATSFYQQVAEQGSAWDLWTVCRDRQSPLPSETIMHTYKRDTIYTKQKKRNDTQLPLIKENKLKQEECGISVKLWGNQTKVINWNCFRLG